MNDTTYKDCIKGLKNLHINNLKWFEDQKGKIIPHSDIQHRKFAKSPKGIYSEAGEGIVLACKSVIKSRYSGRESKIFRNSEGGWYFEYAPEANKKGIKFHSNAKLLRNSINKIPIGVIYQVKEKPSLYEVVGTGLVRYSNELDMFLIYGFNHDGNIRFL